MKSFYFYDLETTSGSPFTGYIMQFAGQRTDENMKPIGEPDNILIRLSDDILPEPDAVLVHGITPQKTLEEGLSEVAFLDYFHKSVATAGTVFVGYNSIRFDDEFTRRINYRNFYDPYQWHWKDDRSRWDLLDPIRMMRALRPEGLKWPMLKDKPTVKLELMAKENGITHENAHDALSDVLALIELASTFKKAQPKLFSYLVGMRDKSKVAELALAREPFVYTSGKYDTDHDKTTVVATVFKHPKRDGAIVYDLRHDPEEWLDKSIDELVTHWTVKYGEDRKRLPVKVMQFNKCPAIAPIGVLDTDSVDRLALHMDDIRKNNETLQSNEAFTKRLRKALDIVENKQQAQFDLEDKQVENQLYDAFWSPADQAELAKIRSTEPAELSSLLPAIKNKRIRELLPRYKARNFYSLLTQEEREEWESYRQKLFYGGEGNSRYATFSKRMQEIAMTRKLTKNDEYLLTELQLYAESILPEPN